MNVKEIKIAPSMLSADFSRFGEEVKLTSESGADFLHLDVMDGVFVNNISFGIKFIADARKYSNAVFDAHLMIEKPWKYIERFRAAGADYITVHYEACGERLKDTLRAIKETGAKCGAVINPDTPVSAVRDVLEECDMLLLMSVFPGFGGQAFIKEVLPKISEAAKLISETEKPIELEVDGGVTLENAGEIKSRGANVLVAGSTVFKEKDRAAIIKRLREI